MAIDMGQKCGLFYVIITEPPLQHDKKNNTIPETSDFGEYCFCMEYFYYLLCLKIIIMANQVNAALIFSKAINCVK
jgi:hypothetical protein